MLESTLPVADLDTPDHIDSYTGEIDPQAAEFRLRIISTPSAVLISDEQKKLMETLKWYEKTLQAFLNAQDGYSEEPGDEVFEWVNEFGQETRGPMWMQIQHDFSSSDRYIELVHEARSYTDRCRELVENMMRLVILWLKVYLNPGDGQKRNEQIVDIVMNLGTWEDEGSLRNYLAKLANRDWPLGRKLNVFATNTVKAYFPVSPEAIEFIEFLKELVQRGESEVDIALIFLSLQNGLMFPEDASMAVPVEITGASGAMTLYDFIEENEEEILANLNDRAPKRIEEPYDLVALVAEQGLKQAISTGEPKSTEVKKTPEYIEGYLRAAMTVKQATYRDENGYHNTLEEAGWSNFRIKRSPEGAELYSDVRMRGGMQAQAMAAFWKQLNLEKRRKEEARIKSVLSDGKGLALANGRQVSWNIAIMKFNSGEFEHNKEEWMKITNFLRSKKVGSYFCQVVEKSLVTM
jgi:hypothetical protein